MEIQIENTDKYFFIDIEGIHVSFDKKSLVTIMIEDYKHYDNRVFDSLIFQYQRLPKKRGRPCKRTISRCAINEGNDYLIIDVPGVNARDILNLLNSAKRISDKKQTDKIKGTIRKGYADFINDLGKFNWTHFITLTSHKRLSLKRARWIVDRMYANLNRNNNVQIFWVAEKHKASANYHLHLLLEMSGTGIDARINDEWQRLSCAKRDKVYARTEIKSYDRKLGAGHYFTKEIFSQKADYDFLFGNKNQENENNNN